jgi:hypothetical protein
MKFDKNLFTIDYSANAGFGITFPTKTFIIKSEKHMYILSPCHFDDIQK